LNFFFKKPNHNQTLWAFGCRPRTRAELKQHENHPILVEMWSLKVNQDINSRLCPFYELKIFKKTSANILVISPGGHNGVELGVHNHELTSLPSTSEYSMEQLHHETPRTRKVAKDLQEVQ